MPGEFGGKQYEEARHLGDRVPDQVPGEPAMTGTSLAATTLAGWRPS